ncbi:MAG: ABC transporter permease subunit, partial [Planctomycetota bacterium]
VLPPVAIGYLLLILLGPTSLVGRWLERLGMPLAFTWLGAALAAAIMGFPLMVRTIRLSMEAVDPALESAARTLGASRSTIFFTITLPLAFPGIIAGALLGFARSLGEFGATITFVGNIAGVTRTLPLALYGYTQIPGGEGLALRLMSLSIALALLAVMASELVNRYYSRRLHGC